MPRPQQKTLIIAHRGDSAHAPENSLPAFTQALAKGADGVEMDLWLCNSGKIIVCHDRNLMRLTGKPGDLKKLSLTQLSTYALGPGIKIPTLDEVLDIVAPLQLINLEIKDVDLSRSLELTQLFKLLKEKNVLEKVVISSFHPLILYRLKRQYPQLKMGLLFQKDSILFLRRAWAAKILKPTHLHPQVDLLTKSLMDQAQVRKQKVIAWTVNDGHDVEKCLQLGVDGIITDDPAWLKNCMS